MSEITEKGNIRTPPLGEEEERSRTIQVPMRSHVRVYRVELYSIGRVSFNRGPNDGSPAVFRVACRNGNGVGGQESCRTRVEEERGWRGGG